MEKCLYNADTIYRVVHSMTMKEAESVSYTVAYRRHYNRSAGASLLASRAWNTMDAGPIIAAMLSLEGSLPTVSP